MQARLWVQVIHEMFTSAENNKYFNPMQARLWVQVIHELRTGIKLKKTEYSKTPIGGSLDKQE
jgi:hypothetical protein